LQSSLRAATLLIKGVSHNQVIGSLSVKFLSGVVVGGILLCKPLVNAVSPIYQKAT